MGCCTSSAQILAEELPTITPASLKQFEGQVVRLIGRIAHNGQLLKAPFTGRQCVCYEAEIYERIERKRIVDGREQRDTDYNKVSHEENKVEFLVCDSDASGNVISVFVPNMSNTECIVHQDHNRTAPSGFDANHFNYNAFLMRNGHNPNTFMNGRNGMFGNERRYLEYKEAVFEPGETVAVMGLVATVNTPRGPCLTMVPIDANIAEARIPEALKKEKKRFINALRDKNGKLIVSDEPHITKAAPLASNWQPQPKAPENPSVPYHTPIPAPPPPYEVKPTGPAQIPPAPGSGNTAPIIINIGR